MDKEDMDSIEIAPQAISGSVSVVSSDSSSLESVTITDVSLGSASDESDCKTSDEALVSVPVAIASGHSNLVSSSVVEGSIEPLKTLGSAPDDSDCKTSDESLASVLVAIASGHSNLASSSVVESSIEPLKTLDSASGDSDCKTSDESLASVPVVIASGHSNLVSSSVVESSIEPLKPSPDSDGSGQTAVADGSVEACPTSNTRVMCTDYLDNSSSKDITQNSIETVGNYISNACADILPASDNNTQALRESASSEPVVDGSLNSDVASGFVDATSVTDNNAKSRRVPFRSWTELTCEVCHRTFTSKRSLTMHVQFVRQNNPFSCDCCCKVFSTALHLEEHKLEHPPELKTFQEMVERIEAKKKKESLMRNIILFV